ncbi:hypothetical protein EVA_04793 [gut metagenome]|uniref:Uncharacterized protein n=1 Tax=gut metagenome TaxID=749906 RepID=J9H155_9ZZZZ
MCSCGESPLTARFNLIRIARKKPKTRETALIRRGLDPERFRQWTRNAVECWSTSHAPRVQQ